MKEELHTKIYTGSLNLELHPVSSHTKMDSTKNTTIFTKDYKQTSSWTLQEPTLQENHWLETNFRDQR